MQPKDSRMVVWGKRPKDVPREAVATRYSFRHVPAFILRQADGAAMLCWRPGG